MIKLNKITKLYGTELLGVTALKDITLTIKEGEFLGVMGTSGCGKTTLLNIIALLDKQTEGRYALNGSDTSLLTKTDKARLRNQTFGFVFQFFNLIENYTVLQNVCLPLKYSDVPRKRWEDMGFEHLESLGIAHLADKIPDELSGGEQQRAAIARALVNNPHIILADEPTGNLDSKTGYNIVSIFNRLCREMGKTVIMVTHDAKIASFASRIVQLSDGKIICDTLPDNNKDNQETLKLNIDCNDGGKPGYETDTL